MQSGIKDGKVTMVMSYEEWVNMSNIFKWSRLNRSFVPVNEAITYKLWEGIMELDGMFDGMVQKELSKVPDYLQMIIRETPTVANIAPTKKEEVIL